MPIVITASEKEFFDTIPPEKKDAYVTAYLSKHEVRAESITLNELDDEAKIGAMAPYIGCVRLGVA